MDVSNYKFSDQEIEGLNHYRDNQDDARLKARYIALLMLAEGIEINKKEFYLPTHHSQPAIYLYFGLQGHNALVPWIWTAIVMNVLGTLTLAFNPGRNKPAVLVPACILLFLGISIEKGIGLIVPGLAPSPLGEIVDYTPSWVEVSVTLGIVSLGVFIVSVLLKPALIIEQWYEAQES